MRIFNQDFDLTVVQERKKAIDLLLVSKIKRFPFLNNILLTTCDIEDVDDNVRDSALAYTWFDYEYERVKISLNFNWLQNGMPLVGGVRKFDGNDVLSLIYHELFHNYFHHFTRHKKYRENYAKLANIVEDYYCNEFLIRLFKESDPFLNDKGIGGILYDKLNDIAKANCKKDLFFTTYDEKPIEFQVIDWFIQHEKTWQQPSSPNSCKSDPREGQGNGSGNGQCQGNGDGTLDDHEYGEKKTKESLDGVNVKRVKEGKVKYSESDGDTFREKTMDNAAELASQNGVGAGEGDFLRFKEKIMKKDPFLNFVKITNTMKHILSKNSFRTYSRPHRKRMDEDVIYKGKQREEGNHILVAVDVSGSVSDAELKKIYEMLNGFLERNKGENSLDIVYWSSCKLTDKHFHQNITDMKELLALKVHSDGGTLVKTLYDFVDERFSKRKVTFMNITDGYWEGEPEVPPCVKEHFIILTENAREERIKQAYPDAKVKCCRVRE